MVWLLNKNYIKYPSRAGYEYSTIDTLDTDKTPETGEKQYLCGACAIPTYLTILKNDEKDPLDVYFTRPLDNILVKSIRNKHSIDPRNECRCYLIRCSSAAACLFVSEKYKK